MNGETTRRGFLAATASAGAALALRSHWGGALAEEASKGRLLHRIDCTQELPPERYFASPGTKIVDGPTGRYREAAAIPSARFGYRFPIEHVGRPHLAVVRYPDDKQRYMCIMDGTSYDLSGGVYTGWAQPLSRKMLEVRQIFWPRWQDCSIVLMTYSAGEPAAAGSIEIYELPDIAPLHVPGDPGDGTRRELGIQYEDPGSIGMAEGAMNHEQWVDRVVQFARHSGQNLLAYPMAWYAGPQFPLQCEPSDEYFGAATSDHNLYVVWSTEAVDWYSSMLERFGKEGLGFQGALTLLRLGSLLTKMNVNLDAIKAGADTFNNMLWNNQVQCSTNDWTSAFNALNFRTLTERSKDKKPLEPWNPPGPGTAPWTGLPLAYGEHGNPGHPGPMFNPLHPTVQEAILGLVSEIGQRYGKYPAFKGISFNMFASAMPWFGSIHSGYDDYSVGLFQKETGIVVPVAPTAPDRFSQRYEFLTYICRPAWVAWRCRKIRELFARIRQALADGREDLRVTVTLWDETMVGGVLSYSAPTAMHLNARLSMLELYREAGIDIDLYRDQPGLEVDRGMGNSRDRGGHGSNPAGGIHRPIEEATMYRDFDFLDQPAIGAFAKHDRPGAFIFDSWVEPGGRYVWFRPEDGDPNLATLSIRDGKPAEGVFRQNYEYPKDGFWWDGQCRIAAAFPPDIHFLEPYAFALAETDACRITRGGLYLDKAHGDLLQQFACAYRALPRQKFSTVGASTDPAAVRYLVHGGRRYFYAINRDYYRVKLELSFSAPSKAAEDLATSEKLDLPQRWTLTLGPYELRSFATAPEVEIAGFTATVPHDIARQLREDAAQALAAFKNVRAKGKFVPGMDELEQCIQTALAEGKLAWLRRALTGYTVRKCRASNT